MYTHVIELDSLYLLFADVQFYTCCAMLCVVSPERKAPAWSFFILLDYDVSWQSCITCVYVSRQGVYDTLRRLCIH